VQPEKLIETGEEIMAEEGKRKSLGRGLSALLGDAPVAVSVDNTGDGPVRSTREVAIDQLRPNPFQPRHHFAEDDLASLEASILELGILQPILVRHARGSDTEFEIIAGERRWRAAQRAQLHQVPVVVRDMDDVQALEIAIVENVQRSDLSALEEADGYQRLMDEFGHTQEYLSGVIGKSRPHIANTLRLLALPQKVKALIEEGSLSAGHGRALLGAADPVAMAREVVKKGLNVRQVEKLVKKEGSGQKASRHQPLPGKDADTLALEANISAALGLKIDIDHKGDSGGQVHVQYQTLEQLDEICRRLSIS
jgi:ParB family transcriptional regulator, chromosome partitioning protein